MASLSSLFSPLGSFHVYATTGAPALGTVMPTWSPKFLGSEMGDGAGTAVDTPAARVGGAVVVLDPAGTTVVVAGGATTDDFFELLQPAASITKPPSPA